MVVLVFLKLRCGNNDTTCFLFVPLSILDNDAGGNDDEDEEIEEEEVEEKEEEKGERREISISISSNSSTVTDGNRGSWNAADRAISTTVSPNGWGDRSKPMQPRSLPSAWRVTKAPPPSVMGPGSGASAPAQEHRINPTRRTALHGLVIIIPDYAITPVSGNTPLPSEYHPFSTIFVR